MANRQLFPIFLVLALTPGLAAETPPVPRYDVGETATVDVIAPLHLIVIDHERTARLRRQEAERCPAIFRFYPDAAEEAESSLRSALAAAREKFLDALEANYGNRTVNEAAVTHPRFQRLVALAQEQSKTIPVSSSLAEIWARGASDEAIETGLVALLRELMAYRIRADSIPEEGTLGARAVKMVTLKARVAVVDLPLVENQGADFLAAKIYTLGRAREELQSSFPAEERPMGKFVAAFLKDNCVLDPELTAQWRKKRTEGVWAADEYEPGQLVVKRGDLIDTRTKAVLDQLRDRAAGDQARREIAKDQQETRTTVAQLHEQAAQVQAVAQLAAEQNRWLLRGIMASSVAFLFVVWRLARWKRSHSLLPAKVRNHEIAGTVICCPACAGTIVLPLELTGPASIPAPAAPPARLEGVTVPDESTGHYWKERALTAERRVQKVGQVVRAGLVPHLARWLMSGLVRGLVGQRKHLLDTQQQAEQELAELEQRLSAVHAPLADRLKAYEERIADLEKDLSARGEENRELINATIAITRKRLEIERSKDRLAWS